MNIHDKKWISLGTIAELQERGVSVSFNKEINSSILVSNDSFRAIFTDFRGNQEIVHSQPLQEGHTIQFNGVKLSDEANRTFYVIYDSESLSQAFVGPTLSLEVVLLSSEDLSDRTTDEITLMLAGKKTDQAINREFVLDYDYQGFQIVGKNEKCYLHDPSEIISSPYEAIELLKVAKKELPESAWSLKQIKQGHINHPRYI
ncbi:hypothetical protein [Vibrio owensii]|uniref:hypothetical protein n=1 Tax=Vibrio owensii TaxID=696485 RepID=UPI003CC607C7